ERKYVDDDELSRMGDRYWRAAREILDTVEAVIRGTATDDDLVEDAVAVLYWFLFFIPVKIKSGLRELLDDEGFEDNQQATDVESYANGTIKVALIAIDRSIVSWKKLLEIGGLEKARSMIELLEQIQCRLETRFPRARDFVRPGFDEVGFVM
ncbi:MAG TPA: hypothetical protein VNA22_01700, partial [Pyrinomonadaceae bacterium]|nr:hypothetical protein [Pyrinomonadaceae bacterium]